MHKNKIEIVILFCGLWEGQTLIMSYWKKEKLLLSPYHSICKGSREKSAVQINVCRRCHYTRNIAFCCYYRGCGMTTIPYHTGIAVFFIFTVIVVQARLSSIMSWSIFKQPIIEFRKKTRKRGQVVKCKYIFIAMLSHFKYDIEIISYAR